MNIPTSFFTVIRVELSLAAVEDMKQRVPGVALGTIISEALRSALPELAQRPAPRMARGSVPGIAVDAELHTDLASLRRSAEHTPPPQRFAAQHRLPVPTDVWREVDKERLRLGMTVDAVVAFALHRAYG